VSEGHAALNPVQFSATSQMLADGRQTVVGGWKESAGQASDNPPQFSATSQMPADARQPVPAATGEQVPTLPGRLHAPQPALQELSQQTPLTQNPLAHWLPDVHPSPRDGS
jgi:hypothetical protein